MSSNAQHSNLSSSTQSYQQSLRGSDLSIEGTKIDFNDEGLALKVPLPHSITAMTQQQADWILAHLNINISIEFSQVCGIFFK